MTSTCERKGRYPTEGLATSIATRRSKQTGDLIKAYRCDECGAWHVGHPSLKAPKAVRRRGKRR